MPELVTVDIPTSGICPRCGIRNNATITARVVPGFPALATSDISCGACGNRFKLTGSVIAQAGR